MNDLVIETQPSSIYVVDYLFNDVGEEQYMVHIQKEYRDIEQQKRELKQQKIASKATLKLRQSSQHPSK